MKPTTNKSKANRKPARERKTPDGVANQLARRAPKKGETVLHFDTLSGNEIQEALKVAKTKSKPTKAEAKPESEVSRGMVNKIRRAKVRTGIAKPSDAECEAYARELLKAGVEIMKCSSFQISKVIKGEAKPESLK